MIQRVLTILSIYDARPRIIRSRPALYVLTGQVNSGKTRTLRHWLCEWEAEGLSLGGIVSDALWNFNIKIGYDLCDLSTGQSWPVIREQGSPCHTQIGRFHLDSEKMQEVIRIARDTPTCDLLVLDEIGPLELERKAGFHDLLTGYLSERNCSLCVVVRNSLLDAFLKHYQEILKQKRMLA
jgi:nucleoside-triphosphatase THEP1